MLGLATKSILKQLDTPAVIVDTNNKITAKNDLWKKQVNAFQEEQLLTNPNLTSLNIDDVLYEIYEIPLKDGNKMICLVRGFRYLFILDLLSKAEETEAELRERFSNVVGSLPIPLIIVDEETLKVLFFNNEKLFLEIFDAQLEDLYSLKPVSEYFENKETLPGLLKRLKKEKKLQGEEIEVVLTSGNVKWWRVDAVRIKFKNKNAIALSISDITKQKQNEKKLAEAYMELATINEELQQQQEELEVLNMQLAKRNKELEDSIKYAKRVQKSFLASLNYLSKIKEYDIGVLFLPQSQISGDFIWSQETEDYYYLGVCDATGHGPGGALMATIGKFALDEAFKQIEGPHQLGNMLSITQELVVNYLHLQDEKVSNFGFEAVIIALPKNPKTDNITVYGSSAKRPLWVVKNDGIDYLKSPTFPIGWVWDGKWHGKYQNLKIVVPRGYNLILFSDGLTDQLNEENKKIGRKRLEKLLLQNKDKSASEQIEIVKDFITKWRGNAFQNDDITLMVIKI